MTRNFQNIGIIFLLLLGVTSCYVVQTSEKIENTSFEQKNSKCKIAVNPNYKSYYGYFYDKVSQKRITEIILADGDRWKVVEQFYKSTNSYYETKHSIPKFKNRNSNDILHGTYYLKIPEFKKISEDNEHLDKVRDSIIYPRRSRSAADSLFFWYSGLQYSLEFDSTGHFIKSVRQPTSDSPVPPHLYFGQYQIKGDTLELLAFGSKRIRSVVSHNKFLYDILLFEPKKEKYLMNITRDTLVDVTNKLYVPVKKEDTLRTLPINKDLSH